MEDQLIRPGRVGGSGIGRFPEQSWSTEASRLFLQLWGDDVKEGNGKSLRLARRQDTAGQTSHGQDASCERRCPWGAWCRVVGHPGWEAALGSSSGPSKPSPRWASERAGPGCCRCRGRY